MAASLAAVFAVVAGPGRWDLFSMLLGLTLLSILLGFFNWESKRKQYRQKRADPELSRSRWWWIDLKVLAFAALVGLCAGLATAWLAQLTLEKVPRVRAGCQQAEDVVLFPLMLQGRGPEGRELTKASRMRSPTS